MKGEQRTKNKSPGHDLVSHTEIEATVRFFYDFNNAGSRRGEAV